jgi:hypothetical protein
VPRVKFFDSPSASPAALLDGSRRRGLRPKDAERQPQPIAGAARAVPTRPQANSAAGDAETTSTSHLLKSGRAQSNVSPERNSKRVNASRPQAVPLRDRRNASLAQFRKLPGDFRCSILRQFVPLIGPTFGHSRAASGITVAQGFSEKGRIHHSVPQRAVADRLHSRTRFDLDLADGSGATSTSRRRLARRPGLTGAVSLPSWRAGAAAAGAG